LLEKIHERVINEGVYIAETGATVRKTALVFGVGKSTVHKDVTKRLSLIDKDLFLEVAKILKINLEERHIRGGEATKRKYLEKKKMEN
jgi:putative DeoR family transcriptional regulator (stage III sporulation protein D)